MTSPIIWTCGADPEVFVGDTTGVRSIIDKIGGSKLFPRELPIGEGYAVQEDNVAMEFNIPAAGSKQAFNLSIKTTLDFLGEMIQDMHGLQIVKDSAVSFPDAELQDERAHVFGCEPDFNAWTLDRNPRPDATDKNLRSCGGHVHVGAKLDKKQKYELIRWMDLYLGVPSVLMDRGELRKQLYGKAGAYRDKKYGVEYRTLSNFWIFDERLTSWVYDQTARALEAVQAGGSAAAEQALILDAIDNNNKNSAMELIARHNLEVINA